MSKPSRYQHTRFSYDSMTGYIYDSDTGRWIYTAEQLWREVRPLLRELDRLRYAGTEWALPDLPVEPVADSQDRA